MMLKVTRALILLAPLTILQTLQAPVWAGPADVVGAEAALEGGATWHFKVTVAHDDSGWEHYADRWDVLGPNGKVLGTRVLLHPHEAEQPFTRSLRGVAVPEGTNQVTLRAHDSEHGYGGKALTIDLPQ